MPKLTKFLTVVTIIIPTASAAILPNLTYPTPTPTLACYPPQVTRSISYDDCRQALAILRLDHQDSPSYALTHSKDPPEEPWFIICPYKLTWGTCILWLDYKHQWGYYPLVEIDFVVHFGDMLARGCVRDGRGAGGAVKPLDAAGLGSAVLRLQYSQ